MLDRVLPAARSLTPAPLLLRLDSGHDELENRLRAEIERIDFLIKWNPRHTDPAKVLAQAEDLGAAMPCDHPSSGKRGGLLLGDGDPDRSGHGLHPSPSHPRDRAEHRPPGDHTALLVPELEIEGWWTCLGLPDVTIIDLCRYHATSEQLHSEFKTDLDLERLPSGKLDTDTLVMAVGSFVYNVLRWIERNGLTGPGSPARHPVKRRRVRTMMQKLIALPAMSGSHGCASSHIMGFTASQHVRQRLRACASG